LPTYNALKDQYLLGFFDNPDIKRHLRKTGILRKKQKKNYFIEGAEIGN
jgi:hypothetical protein